MIENTPDGIRRLAGNDAVGEKIAHAAVSYKGEVFIGTNHGEAFNNLARKYPNAWNTGELDVIDGFTTSTGRFVDIDTALQIAKTAGQVGENETRKTFDSSFLRE